ncbi:uncharacterized protein LOC128397644 [Panonychus citri]|uniref:uncharacterized protein LOC128386408 n=1 Tax=Panonychus citri TaxID=50023 RepID=UPI00230807A0|nr:uncharacterized protein LOC128386408 [Panonychus citri]XP_053214363.1 uncharacterized protein LOC128397644 [Panonychus citri]
MSKIFQKISKLSLSELIEFLSFLRLDIYFALFTLGFMSPGIPTSQFIQDKYCINQLKLEPSVCLNLEKLDGQYETIKNDVYTFSTTFKNYQFLIATPPGIILAIFMGYWMDTYPSHLKYLLALPCFGGCLTELISIYNVVYFELDIYNLLWVSLPNGFTGGFFIVMTGSYTYITRRTPAKYRAARFAVFELFMFTSMTLSTALGGKILTLRPWIIDQYRNYLAVFIVAFACKLIAMIWILLLLNDADKALEDPNSSKLDSSGDKFQKINNSNEQCKEVVKMLPIKDNENNIYLDINEEQTIELEPLKGENNVVKSLELSVKEKHGNMEKPTGCLPIMFDIFNPSTFTTMMKVCCRKRPNNGRAIIWNLMLAMNVMLIGHIGEGTIGFPFAQKVYHWDAAYYSYISSAVMMIPTLINSMLPIILIHKFHLADTTLAIIGSISLILSLTIKGGILESHAFFISVIVGISGGLLPIAIRSIISRIIDQSEAGQVYALLACIESSGPMVASVVYSAIFNWTIKDFPGIVHHFAALTMFYPFIVSLWLDWTKSNWDPTAIKVKVNIGENKENELETVKSTEPDKLDVTHCPQAKLSNDQQV